MLRTTHGGEAVYVPLERHWSTATTSRPPLAGEGEGGRLAASDAGPPTALPKAASTRNKQKQKQKKQQRVQDTPGKTWREENAGWLKKTRGWRHASKVLTRGRISPEERGASPKSQATASSSSASNRSSNRWSSRRRNSRSSGRSTNHSSMGGRSSSRRNNNQSSSSSSSKRTSSKKRRTWLGSAAAVETAAVGARAETAVAGRS